MKIDSINALRKYSKKGDKVSVTKSDHHLLISHFNVKWSRHRNTKTIKRNKKFNFSSVEGWKTYKYLTSSNQLTKCIKGVNLQEECRIWMKKFKNILHRSFKVLNVSRKPKIDLLHEIMCKRSKLLETIEVIKKNCSFSNEQKIQTITQYLFVIDHFDKKIADICFLKNSEKIRNNFLNLIDNGQFSSQKMWKVNKKLSCKNNGLPVAKYDKNNQLITTKHGILSLYEEEYKNRLSLSPPHKGYEELQHLKNCD